MSHMRYPYVLGTNMTFGDNNERRPHIRTIGTNTRNKNMPFVDGFLPSQQPYIFTWYFTVALPTILNPAALQKTQIMITDQCPHMCPALESAISDFNFYGNARSRRCKWHKVRNWTDIS